jgi:hypothetical protein
VMAAVFNYCVSYYGESAPADQLAAA